MHQAQIEVTMLESTTVEGEMHGQVGLAMLSPALMVMEAPAGVRLYGEVHLYNIQVGLTMLSPALVVMVESAGVEEEMQLSHMQVGVTMMSPALVVTVESLSSVVLVNLVTRITHLFVHTRSFEPH